MKSEAGNVQYSKAFKVRYDTDNAPEIELRLGAI